MKRKINAMSSGTDLRLAKLAKIYKKMIDLRNDIENAPEGTIDDAGLGGIYEELNASIYDLKRLLQEQDDLFNEYA